MRKQVHNLYFKRTFSAIILFLLGFGFSVTIGLWIHEGGHILGALLTGSQITEVNLMPPWQGHVNAIHYSILAQNIFLLGGFLFTFIPFLCALAISIHKKSRIAYFMIFPLLMTLPSSQGDLKFIGLYIPELAAFVVGWFVPSLIFAIALFPMKTTLKVKRKNGQELI